MATTQEKNLLVITTEVEEENLEVAEVAAEAKVAEEAKVDEVDEEDEVSAKERRMIKTQEREVKKKNGCLLQN